MLSMREDGVIKMLKGVTSFDEVLSVVDLNEE
jgi:type II secretory ATPase GspE/PulE/Tfp pilus assembly ATPase PilB-like protein